MTLKEIQKRNEQFQQKAARLVDLLPGGGLLDVSTGLIRSARLIDKYLIRLVHATEENKFNQAIRLVEDELDESVYLLDQVDRKNRKFKLDTINSFLKEGYELISFYSLCCDQLVSSRIETEKDEEIL